MRRWMRPELSLFVLLFGTYAYFYPAGGWNQNSRFDLTRALVEGRSISIDAYRSNTDDVAERNGHAYCDKAPGVSLMAAIPYAIIYAARGSRRPGTESLDDAAYVSTLVAVGIPSALGAVMLLLLLDALGIEQRARTFSAAAYGLGTLAFPYSTMLYGHQVAASLLIAAFALLARERRGARSRPLCVGALLGWSIAVEYPAALGAIALAVYAAYFLRSARCLAWIALGAAVPALILAAYHTAAFGGPATLPYAFSTEPPRHAGFFMGIGAPSGHALAGILFTDYRGLFFSSPWLLLAAPGLWALARDPMTRAEAIVCASVTTLFVWLNASLVDWEGGYAVGARYLVPAIPFLAVGASKWPSSPRHADLARAVGTAFAICSCALMLIAVAVDPQPSVRIAHPFREYLLPEFAKGRLAESAQGIDSSFAPDNGRPRAWNIGTRAGLTGQWSLAPLAAFALVTLSWFSKATREPVRGPKRNAA